MRISESQLRRIVRRMLSEQKITQQEAMREFTKYWNGTPESIPFDVVGDVIAAFGRSEKGQRKFADALLAAGFDAVKGSKAIYQAKPAPLPPWFSGLGASQRASANAATMASQEW